MKLLPAEIVTDQFKTYRSAIDDQVAYRDLITFCLIPLAFGIVAGLWGTVDLDVSAILAAVAVYTGLIFNLAFHVFDKSLSMRRDPFLSADADAVRLVDELQANVNYTVLVGVALTGLLATMLLFDIPPSWPEGMATVAAKITTGVVAGVLLHMLFLSGMILKRFTALHSVLKP